MTGRTATIVLTISVNDGPPCAPIALTVSDGDSVHINQPVAAFFEANGEPIPLIKPPKRRKPRIGVQVGT